MSDRMYASINIGGKIPKNQRIRAKLFELLCEENECSNEGLVDPKNLADFCNEDGYLHLENFEARWGMFEDLERFCTNNEIAFMRQSDGIYEHTPEIVWFIPGKKTKNGKPQGIRGCMCDHELRPMIHITDIQAVLDKRPQILPSNPEMLTIIKKIDRMLKALVPPELMKAEL